MKTYIIYHQIKPGFDCPDGLAAAWVASLVHPEASILGWSYQTEPPDIFTKRDRVFVVDFSFPTKVLEGWADAGIEIIVIDHHKTALDDLTGLSDRVLQSFDMNECGATLTWKFFFPQIPPPTFLLYVRDRDLWLHELPHTKEIHAAMSGQRSFELFDEIMSLDESEFLDRFVPIGKPILERRHRKAMKAAKRWQIQRIAGRNIPIVELKESEASLTSDICQIMYSELPETKDYPFVGVVVGDKYSLRSNQKTSNTDVSAIARRYGGGGHRNAAGFTKKLPEEA